jgi:hypothetical protein
MANHPNRSRRRYAVQATQIDTGEPWTYWDVFDTLREAREAAARMNGARQPVVRDAVAVEAGAEHIERALRNRRMLA